MRQGIKTVAEAYEAADKLTDWHEERSKGIGYTGHAKKSFGKNFHKSNNPQKKRVQQALVEKGRNSGVGILQIISHPFKRTLRPKARQRPGLLLKLKREQPKNGKWMLHMFRSPLCKGLSNEEFIAGYTGNT